MFQKLARGVLDLLGLLPMQQPEPAAGTDDVFACRPLKRAPRAVLFLDFDGVLHSGNSGTFSLLPQLEAVLRGYPEIDIVLSTSWRTAELSFLQNLFAEDIASRVIGSTPHLEGKWVRGREILDTVRRYGIRQWVVLDDDKRLFGPDFPNVIFTDFKVGLTQDHLFALTKRFDRWRDTPPDSSWD